MIPINRTIKPNNDITFSPLEPSLKLFVQIIVVPNKISVIEASVINSLFSPFFKINIPFVTL